jgi:hypothetical protein
MIAHEDIDAIQNQLNNPPVGQTMPGTWEARVQLIEKSLALLFDFVREFQGGPMGPIGASPMTQKHSED